MKEWIARFQVYNYVMEMGRNSLTIIFVLIAGFISVKIGKIMIHNFFSTQKKMQKYKMSDRKADTLSTLLISILRYTVYFIIIVNILALFNVKMESVLAVAGVGGIAVGFGAQSLVKDIISGFFILLEDQFGVGDIVNLQSKTGTVEELGLRTTRIRSFDGDVHIIPNGEIRIVTNMTKQFKRAVVDIHVSYEQNLDQVLKIIRSIAESAYEQVPGMLAKPEILGVQELGSSSVVIRMYADCNIKENWAVERELRKRIKDTFQEMGIEIPYPHSKVYVINEKQQNNS